MNRATIIGRWSENGQSIRKARRRAGFSQERFALAVGTTRRHMIRLENGEHLPSRGLRDRITAAAGIGKAEVQSSDDEDEEPSLPHDLVEALRTIARYVGERQS